MNIACKAVEEIVASRRLGVFKHVLGTGKCGTVDVLILGSDDQATVTGNGKTAPQAFIDLMGKLGAV